MLRCHYLLRFCIVIVASVSIVETFAVRSCLAKADVRPGTEEKLWFDKGNEAFRNSRWSEADTYFLKASTGFKEGRQILLPMTLFMLALTSFKLHDYENCQARLKRLSQAELTFTARGERPIAVPLELAGDISQAVGQFASAKKYYEQALHAKVYQKLDFTPEQELRLTEKLDNVSVRNNLFPAEEYIREYMLALSMEEYRDPSAVQE